jgi:tetratricopeptide (TPR) repeat protein
VFEAVKADTHPALIRTLFRLAELRLARKQYDSAVSLFRQTNAHIERLHGPNYLALAATAPGYASALRKTGRKDEARAVEERAAMIRRAVPVELAGRHTVDLKSLLPRAK